MYGWGWCNIWLNGRCYCAVCDDWQVTEATGSERLSSSKSGIDASELAEKMAMLDTAVSPHTKIPTWILGELLIFQHSNIYVNWLQLIFIIIIIIIIISSSNSSNY